MKVQELQQQEQKAKDSNQLSISHKTFTSTLVTNDLDWEFLLNALETSERWAYDTETNGVFDRSGIAIVGISFAIINDRFNDAFYVPFLHNDGEQLPISYLDDLKPVFANEEIEKIAHNLKFDERVLSKYGIETKGFPHDTSVMAWLLDESHARRKLEVLIDRYLGVKKKDFETVIEEAPKPRGKDRDYNFAQVKLEDALDYAGGDAYYCHTLYGLFKTKLVEQGLWESYINIDGPFNRLLKKIEDSGACVDIDALNKADKRLPKLAEEMEASIYEEAGEVFNIRSGDQLGIVLFEKLGIGKNVPKTPTRRYKTDKSTLENYASQHPVVADVLRYKKIQKTYSTFVKGTKKHLTADNRLHPSFNGCGTVTGRLSCSRPNLQNIEGDEVEEIKIRDFFVASEGNKLIVADYAQIEYRLMAHFSKDEHMLNAFLTGRDFHEETARKVFNIDSEDAVPHRKRFIAKAINFGISYGRQAKSLAETLECSVADAEQYIQDYFVTFSGLANYKKYFLHQARKRGYIRTLAGRKRRLPDLQSDKFWIRVHAERQAFNAKMQGSAADIIKMAMISLEPKLNEIGAFMVIQIHDELVIDTPKDDVEDVVAIVKTTMENPLNGKNPIRLPLVVEPIIADRWGEAK